MIRRLFWLTLGAWLGISGYRRVTRLVHGLTAGSRPGASPRRAAVFVRALREGMDLYAARQEAQRPDNGPRAPLAGPTLDHAR